jgi:hypothetical protein
MKSVVLFVFILLLLPVFTGNAGSHLPETNSKLIESKTEIPLISFKDARILIVTQICTTQIEMEQKIKQMQKRHIKRKADINWNYNKQKLEQSKIMNLPAASGRGIMMDYYMLLSPQGAGNITQRD